jgi:hypothetical protein
MLSLESDMTILLMIAAAAIAVDQSAPNPAPTVPAQEAPALSPDGFQSGVDTLATVSAKLGKPNSVTTMADGSTIAAYISSKTRVKGATFIPVVGLFAGGAKGSMSIKTFTFGKDGKLRTFTSSDTNTNCSSSIVGAGCH